MSAYTMTIGGESISATDAFDVIDPATGRPFTQAPAASAAHVDRAMECATTAFKAWSRDVALRRAALLAAADAVQAQAEPLARLLTQEQGKPLRFAQREVLGASGTLRLFAKLPLEGELLSEDEQTKVSLRRRPYGVVAAITPWNYPILIATNKIGTALLTGNTVVLKPSEFTPLATLLLGSIIAKVLPPGVLNVISGAGDVGRLMSEHPAVRKISFTGSVATGKKVALSAASDLKRVTLELGGNDPAIVLGDVDPQKVANALFWGAFMNSGQVCTAIKRLYVHESIFPRVVSAVTEVAKRAKVGPGLSGEVDLGPVNNAPQQRIVADLLADAQARGATVHTGGARQGDGYFFDPVVLTDVDDGARIVAEEQFGPVLPVLPFREIDDVIERANASHFGLSASVWSSDLERATEIAEQLDCGTTWINQHMALSQHAPFGGSKWSGIGYENGRWGIDAFTQLQVVNVRRSLST